MKKIILSMLSVLAISSSGIEACAFKGPYLGMGVGAGQSYGRDMYSQGSTLYSSTKVRDHSPIGTLYGGYSFCSQNLYLGIEAQVSRTNYRLDQGAFISSLLNTYAHASYKSRYNWGLSLRPGLILSPTTLAYVSLGLSQYSLRGEGSIVGVNYGMSYKTRSTFSSPSMGVGMEKVIKPGVKLGMDITSTLNRTRITSPTSYYGDRFKLRFGNSVALARLSFAW